MHKLYLTYANADHRIQSIKDLRAATGMGLKEAKAATDKLLGIGYSEGKPPQDEVLLNDYMIVLGDAHAEQVYDALYHALYIDGRLEKDEATNVVQRSAAKLAIVTTLETPPGVAYAVLAAQAKVLDSKTAAMFEAAAELLREVYS
jgi:hypothetical protein